MSVLKSLMGTFKNWFATTKVSEAEPEQTRGVAKIAQIESRAQACLSMTEMQAMTQSVNTMQGEHRTTELAWLYDRTVMVTQSVHNGVISHFEQRLLQKLNTTVKLALPLLRQATGLSSTMVMCHNQFVAVSRCSILTPAGLQISSAKPDVPQREPASGCRKKNFRGALKSFFFASF